ncbi:MAG: AraC family transcriptional regulator [Myxococcota bacterium]
MSLAHLTRRVETHLRGRVGNLRAESLEGEPIAGLSFYRRTAPTEFQAFVYDPLVCLILQGTKETSVGDRMLRASAGEHIVVSHDLPVVARITEASEDRPYVALIARLDVSELRSLHDEVGGAGEADASGAYAVAPVDDALLAVLTRYVALLDEPAAAPVLVPLIRRELSYRLLHAGNGAMLRTLLHRDSHASRIGRAIDRLRNSYRERLEVPALARSVGMSTSAFHKHFRRVTATTPLQYQKDLRLTEARRLLESEAHSVSTAAFEVGYESATQFSREFSRKFGAPPSALRGRTAAAS